VVLQCSAVSGLATSLTSRFIVAVGMGRSCTAPPAQTAAAATTAVTASAARCRVRPGVTADTPDFADLVSGKCAGRVSRDQVTFYRNVGNQGLQFSAVGGWVYAQAVQQKRGREIPTAWFLQDIRD